MQEGIHCSSHTTLPPSTPPYYTRPQPDTNVCIQLYVSTCMNTQEYAPMCAHIFVPRTVLENNIPFSPVLCSNDNDSLSAEPKGKTSSRSNSRSSST